MCLPALTKRPTSPIRRSKWEIIRSYGRIGRFRRAISTFLWATRQTFSTTRPTRPSYEMRSSGQQGDSIWVQTCPSSCSPVCRREPRLSRQQGRSACRPDEVGIERDTVRSSLGDNALFNLRCKFEPDDHRRSSFPPLIIGCSPAVYWFWAGSASEEAANQAQALTKITAKR